MTSVELVQKFQLLSEVRSELKSLEEQEAALIDELKAEMLSRGVEELRAGIFSAKWTKYTTHRFDTKVFKSDHSDLYAQYTVAVEASRFSVN